MNAIVSLIGHNRLDFIRRRITEGFERANKGGAEWIEGSLIMAIALREARDAHPANISFSDWLKQSKLDFLYYHDRAALINMAANPELMRTVLAEGDSRSYQRIWGANRKRFVSTNKTAEPKKRRTQTGRGMIHRTMKLGESTIAKIKGTSLDSAAEMDELIMLNRGAPVGELTDIVKQLVEDAAAGKDVSAIAYTANLMPRRTSGRGLIEAWRKRMTSAWQMAKQEERVALIAYLVNSLEAADQNKVVEHLIDNLGKGNA
jgi:hypothetical protein